jgi:hypothetical protein
VEEKTMTEREKQIEEIAKIIFMYDSVNSTDEDVVHCAKHIYNKGYRKQRYCENLTENHPVDEFICSECGLITRENTRIEIDEDADGDEAECEFEIKFCPRCGSKVKGGESDD